VAVLLGQRDEADAGHARQSLRVEDVEGEVDARDLSWLDPAHRRGQALPSG
jgi:hypothetical protein